MALLGIDVLQPVEILIRAFIHLPRAPLNGLTGDSEQGTLCPSDLGRRALPSLVILGGGTVDQVVVELLGRVLGLVEAIFRVVRPS